MYCPYCGDELPHQSRYCISCGRQIPEAAGQLADVSPPQEPPGASWPPDLDPSRPAWGESPVPAAEEPQSRMPSPTPLASGNDPTLLDRLPRWNWGAFLLSWIWAFGHGLWWWGVGILAASLLTCGLLQLPAAVVLGTVGNREAWKARPFRDLEEFARVQRRWTLGGLLVWGISLAFWGGLVVLSLILEGEY